MARRKTSHHPVRRAFVWTKERQNVLEYLAEYSLLRIKDIVFLRGVKDDRATHNTLSDLLREKYIGRLPFVDEFGDSPARVHAYYLNPSGAEMLDNPHAALSKESLYIPRHDIEITQFHIHLKQWTEKAGLKLHWYQPKMDHKKEINPDAYFGIEDRSKPAGQNFHHFFLEVERAKIGNYRNGEPSIVRKLGKYYDYFDSKDCEKEWGFKQFRVIVVVRNADKQYNLCERLTEFKHRMFWVTTEPAYKENIKGSIFKTPKDYDAKAYSFLDL
jgi:hypothetical protein